MITGAARYNQINATAEIESVDQHRLIQMLIDGALSKMIVARSMMERKDQQKKGENVSWAINIINGLQSSLNKDAGGEIAQNLDDLYSYITLRLVQANANNDLKSMDEVISLFKTLKEGWDGIRSEALQIFAEQNKASVG